MTPERETEIRIWYSGGRDLRSACQFVGELLAEVAQLRDEKHGLIAAYAKLLEGFGQNEPKVEQRRSIMRM